MRDLAFTLGLLVMLVYAVGRPHIGVLLWCWTALLIPNSYVYSFAKSIPFNFIVATFTLLMWVLSKERARIPFNGTVVTLIVFGVLGTVSAVFGIGTPEVTWVEWEKFIKMMIFAVVVSAIINSRARIDALVWAILFSLGFHGVSEGIKFLLTGGGHRIWGPDGSIIGDNNHFALAILSLIPLVFYLYRQTAHRALRVGLLGVGALLFFTVMGTFSRGGLIGLVAIVAWAFLHSPHKFRYLAAMIPLVAALVAVAPDQWVKRMDTIEVASQDTSFMGRVIAWKQSTVIALDHPVLGGGFHAVQDNLVWRQYAATRFHDLDFIPTDDPDPDGAHAAHSIYFQVLGDMGFVGLSLFLLLSFLAWRNTVVVIKKVKGREDLAWAGQLAQYVQYSLIAYLVSGAALSLAYFELMYILFAVLASLRMIVDKACEPTKPFPGGRF